MGATSFVKVTVDPEAPCAASGDGDSATPATTAAANDSPRSRRRIR